MYICIYAYMYIYVGVATMYRSESRWEIGGFAALYR